MKKITPGILGFRSGSDPLKKTHNTTWVSTNHFPLSQGPFLWPDKLERASYSVMQYIYSKVYRLQRESGRVSWTTHVRDALIRYGSKDAWLHGTGPNIKSFTESFKSEVWKREQKLITCNRHRPNQVLSIPDK